MTLYARIIGLALVAILATAYVQIQGSSGTSSPLTTNGDLYYYNAGNARLPVGSAGQVLTVSGGFPTWAAPGGGTTHNLLSATHTDSTIGTVARGDVITGQGVTPTWTRLALGTVNRYLKSDGTDIVYSSGAAAGTGTCTNQFVSATNADASPSCTTVTLASAQFANQGATNQVLHGNAAGNPSWAAVNLASEITGTLPLANGGTNQTTWTAARCVRVNAGGTALEAAAGDCTTGSGLTSLNSQTGSTQTFANDTNVTISSAANTHTLGWSGTLAVARGGIGVGTLTGLAVGNGTSAFSAYGGTSCTNQFPRSLNASGAATCATVGTTDVATALRSASKSVTIDAPTTSASNKIQWEFPSAITITEVVCSTDTGTVTIQLDERARATPNTAGTNVLTSSLVCDSDSQSTTGFSNAGIAADVPLNLQVSAVASSPGVVRVHVQYTID